MLPCTISFFLTLLAWSSCTQEVMQDVAGGEAFLFPQCHSDNADWRFGSTALLNNQDLLTFLAPAFDPKRPVKNHGWITR
ncbi:hypothetical protein HG15A2_14450 [Adhaeretor mobilis]|uniref:Uncharacterized protein n=1 Tax=Adhaeretor mobilis TaxID=1930276 RepID=A0A517MTJ1_9BACT|nr:hypothetical protein HG15A2_14450 [Adhaeretor mobilis]